MKTMKLTMVAMGLMAGMLTAGTAMAQGGYSYDDGYGGGGVVVSSGCGDPNCRNCGGGGYSGGYNTGKSGGYNGGYGGGYDGGTVIYNGGQMVNNRQIYSGGNQFNGNFGGRPMSGGSQWQIQDDYRRQEQMSVRVQDPGLAVVGGILGGIGGALNKDRAKNGAAGDILTGIGVGVFMGAQPDIMYNTQEQRRQQGEVINWPR